jgi:ABC-2 type transport system permease protein
VPLPGESPMKSKPGNNFSAVLVQMAGFAGIAVLLLPEIVLSAIALATGAAIFGWISLAVALVLGSTLLVVGIRLGARQYNERGPELLLAVSADR